MNLLNHFNNVYPIIQKHLPIQVPIVPYDV
jgi:hypothetical protein